MRLGTALRLPLLLLLLLASLAATACGARTASAPGDPPPPPPAAVPLRAEARTPRADDAAILARWHERRTAAWAAGDPTALRDLYAAGAGRADVRLLTRYRRRGLLVEGSAPQLLAVSTVAGSRRRRVLDATWRVSGSRVVRTRDGTSRAVPASGPTTSRFVLTRRHGAWRVAAIQ